MEAIFKIIYDECMLMNLSVFLSEFLFYFIDTLS